MRTTDTPNNIQPVTVDVKGLTELLHCGRVTAEKIANEAGAKIKYGKRALYNVQALKEYTYRKAKEQSRQQEQGAGVKDNDL